MQQDNSRSSKPLPFYRWRKRLNDFRFFILLSLFIFFVFLFLMARQAQVVQKSYANAAEELALKRLRVALVQRQEDIHKNLDLNNIRNLAQLSGLFAPQEGQMIRIKINQRDYVRLKGTKNAETEEFDREIEQAMQYIGTYFEKKRVENSAKRD